jgi:predicted AAA+ superfamily ATPase
MAAFELRQAMGGGKTHSMLALGFLARSPELANSLNGSITEGFTPEPATVIVVSGRNIDQDQFLWGTIAQQLGKAGRVRKILEKRGIAPNEG